MRHLLLVSAVALVVGCDAGSGESTASDTVAGAAAFTSAWHGPDGRPAARTDAQGYSPAVHANEGPPHCEWEPAVFLSVGWPLGTSPLTSAQFRQYLRDPEGAVRVPEEVLLGELDLDVEMPPEATSSGYGTAEAELWFGADGGETYAYLKTSAGVERWPRSREAIACA